ncbi:MAG: DUF3299 domain-containing protein [Steroidobacteraceae bacterium]
MRVPSVSVSPALAAAVLLAGASLFARPAPAVTPPAATQAAPAVAQTQAKPRTAAPASKPGSAAVLELDWDELLPKDARSRFAAGPPPPVHDYLGEGGLAAQQIMDFSVNKELDGQNVKLPGFIVPLDIGKDGLVAEFFLVPYFGACIHVPPPPPNQIVYVRMNKGIALDSIYEAYWITGRMKLQNKTTRLGAAAYHLAGDKVEIYKY